VIYGEKRQMFSIYPDLQVRFLVGKATAAGAPVVSHL